MTTTRGMQPAGLVTGASSGLGRALALELAQSGRHVALLARDGARLAEVAREIQARGGQATCIEADVRDEAGLRRALDDRLGDMPVDRVVHAAGVLALGPMDTLSSDDFRRCLEVNVLGSAHVVRAMLARLERTHGRIALIASIAGALALPGGFSAYSASKWGVRGLAACLRPELAARGVHVLCACPSILDTPMLAHLGSDAPAVYRVFPWHSPENAARRILADLERGRRESFTTLADRLAAWGAGAAPGVFTTGLHAWIRFRDRTSGGAAQ
jgi:NAD(P)-dependent dehydrogenase (short-subunit alcohol dehydrogenase family)